MKKMRYNVKKVAVEKLKSVLLRGVMAAALAVAGGNAVAQTEWTASTVNDTSYWLIAAVHFNDDKDFDGFRFLNHSLSAANGVSSSSVWGYRTGGVPNAYQLGFANSGSASFLAWGNNLYNDGEFHGQIGLMNVGVAVSSASESVEGLTNGDFFYNRTAGLDDNCKRYAYNVIVYDKDDNTFKRQTFYNYSFLDEGEMYYYGSNNGSTSNQIKPISGNDRRYITWISRQSSSCNIDGPAVDGEYVQLHTTIQPSVPSGTQGYFRVTPTGNIQYKRNGITKTKHGATWCESNPFYNTTWRDDYIDTNTIVKGFEVKRVRMESVTEQGGFAITSAHDTLSAFRGSSTVTVDGTAPVRSIYAYDRYSYHIDRFYYRNKSGNPAFATEADTAFYRYVATDGTAIETHTAPEQSQIRLTISRPTLVNRQWFITGDAADYLSVEREYSMNTSNRVFYDKRPSPTPVTGTVNVVNIYNDGTTDTMRVEVTAEAVRILPSSISLTDITLERGRTAEVDYRLMGSLAGFPDYDAFVDIISVDYEIECTDPVVNRHTALLNETLHTFSYIPGTNTQPTITAVHDGTTRIIVTARFFDQEGCQCYASVSDTAAIRVIPRQPAVVVDGFGRVFFTPSDPNPDCPDSIFYTTDGTSPQVTNGVANASTIRYIAGGSDWQNPTNVLGPFSDGTPLRAAIFCHGQRSIDSVVTVSVVSGVYNDNPNNLADSTVLLNDFENHNWAYYSQTDSPVKNLYPRNLKIYYEGNGKVFTGADVAAPLMTQSGSEWVNKDGVADVDTGVGLGIDHPTVHRFIYQKTLERVQGEADNGSDDYFVYTTIPNPFSRRPTVPDDAITKWRGFAGWMIESIEGGAISDYNVGDIIPAETMIHILPTDRTRTNAHNDVDKQVTLHLKAVWGRAYRVNCTASSNNSNVKNALKNTALKGTNYERNFVVITGSNSGDGAAFTESTQKPVTITMVEPDASQDYRTPTCYLRGVYNCNKDTKFEYINLRNVSEVICANENNLIFGRGVSNPTGRDVVCVRVVNGTDKRNAGAYSDVVANPQYTIRIESGVYDYVSLTKGYIIDNDNHAPGNQRIGGTIKIKAVFGNDYDRSINEGRDGDLEITKNVIMGRATYETAGITTPSQAETCNIWVKSGKIGSSLSIDANYKGEAYQVLYACFANTVSDYVSGKTYRIHITGRRNLFIEGGELAGVAGGYDGYFQARSETFDNSGKAVAMTGVTNTGETSFYLKMSGGRVRGMVYGGGAYSPANGDRTMIFTGGVVDGWIGAGCNGTEDRGGITYGASHIYFGGTSHCGGENKSVNMNGSCGGHLFAAGKGYPSENGTSGEMTFGTQLVLADSCVVDSNVYGGGNYGYAKASSVIRMYGGTVGGSMFGGSNLKQGPSVDIKISGGLIKGGVYGGSNTTGTLGKENNEEGNVSIVISGGQVGVDADHTANIHGGGYGQETKVKGNVDITVSDSAVVFGDIYGGSALGTVNSTATTYSASGHTTVNVTGGSVNGSVYGGGLGNSTTAAHVYAPVTVNVSGGSITNVFGCNNLNGMPQGTVVVNIDSTSAGTSAVIGNVYGGGNQAAYGNATNNANLRVNMTGGHITGNLFGGGLGASAINHKGTNVTITGHNSVIDGNVYGGGSEAKVEGSTDVKVGNE